MYDINYRFTDSYLNLLEGLMTNGKEKSPRGQKVKYFQNYLFEVDHPGDVYTCESRKYPVKYLNHELNLYFSGELSAEKFGEASKFWLQLANPDGTINSNYGYLIFHKPIENKFGTIKNQWTYAKTQLLNDKDTRQALMFVSSPHVQFEGNKDFICTLNYCFNIEDDTLNLTVNRRSQDVILGLTFDYAWEYLLLVKMHNELLEKYPDLKIGSYTMFCNNVHVYERNFDLVNKMIADGYNSRNDMMMLMTEVVDKDIIDKYVLNKDF